MYHSTYQQVQNVEDVSSEVAKNREKRRVKVFNTKGEKHYLRIVRGITRTERGSPDSSRLPSEAYIDIAFESKALKRTWVREIATILFRNAGEMIAMIDFSSARTNSLLQRSNKVRMINLSAQNFMKFVL